jgi:N-acyl-D-aspartate/D-glutamate deacylase
MSTLPADRLSLGERSRIREGAYADIAVLDRERVSDPSDFGNPHQYAEGARHVLVNGILVLKDGEVTGARPGRAIRHGSLR